MTWIDAPSSYGNADKPADAATAKDLCHADLTHLWQQNRRTLISQAWEPVAITRTSASVRLMWRYGPCWIQPSVANTPALCALNIDIQGSGPAGNEVTFYVIGGLWAPVVGTSTSLLLSLPSSIGRTSGTLTPASTDRLTLPISYPVATAQNTTVPIVWLWMSIKSDGATATELRSLLIEEIIS